jgi:hypothetical protein
MPRYDQYYIVEFRVPIKVESVSSIQEAMSRAHKICQNQHGFRLDNWFARIFEYSTADNVAGPVKEYFYNPHSVSYRELTKNIEYFTDLVKKGELPPDISDYAAQKNKLVKQDSIDINIEESYED